MVPSAITYQHHFQKGLISPESCAIAMTGTVIKHSDRDREAWHEYIERVLKHRDDWKDGYKACADKTFPDA